MFARTRQFVCIECICISSSVSDHHDNLLEREETETHAVGEGVFIHTYIFVRGQQRRARRKKPVYIYIVYISIDRSINRRLIERIGSHDVRETMPRNIKGDRIIIDCCVYLASIARRRLDRL